MSQACQTLMIFQYDLYLTGPDPQRASTTCGCHVHRHDYKALNGFCWSASFLFSKCISERVRVIKFCGYPLSLRC